MSPFGQLIRLSFFLGEDESPWLGREKAPSGSADGRPDHRTLFHCRLRASCVGLGCGHSSSPGTRPTCLCIASTNGSTPRYQLFNASTALLTAAQEHFSEPNFIMGPVPAVVMSSTSGLQLVHFSAQRESSLALETRNTPNVSHQKVLTSGRQVDDCVPLVVPRPWLVASMTRADSSERALSISFKGKCHY